ncbi:hypothetical protein CIHG_02525 [Coccidioides immitis H538.4]|uniref:Uncharacterized protein n=3 Tax=Coccidioides immitis TaxID=5501 RepID=A0A0J8R498_COCIT|nr:hypothetical protein CIRG_02858 [Coccidioides immitis RMSCC 2394]KMU79240.1 hypothetical protein CISG_07671 [Coccidioides immitis RMSCC 3703]KMU84741.1 hypothetical protein CIHG_02525 [Coccidioides immitis H538.4]
MSSNGDERNQDQPWPSHPACVSSCTRLRETRRKFPEVPKFAQRLRSQLEKPMKGGSKGLAREKLGGPAFIPPGRFGGSWDRRPDLPLTRGSSCFSRKDDNELPLTQEKRASSSSLGPGDGHGTSMRGVVNHQVKNRRIRNRGFTDRYPSTRRLLGLSRTSGALTIARLLAAVAYPCLTNDRLAAGPLRRVRAFDLVGENRAGKNGLMRLSSQLAEFSESVRL